jgi:hypothetical protein
MRKRLVIGVHALRGLNGVDLLDQFILLHFLNELEKFVPGHVQVGNSRVQAVLVHKVVDVFQHVSTLNKIKPTFSNSLLILSARRISPCDRSDESLRKSEIMRLTCWSTEGMLYNSIFINLNCQSTSFLFFNSIYPFHPI